MGYKSYTAEYKTKVVLEVLREEKPLGEIASGYGLNPNMVRNWKTDFLARCYRRPILSGNSRRILSLMLQIWQIITRFWGPEIPKMSKK